MPARWAIAVTASVFALSGCDSAGPDDDQAVASLAAATAIDLISPTTCQVAKGKLRSCVIATQSRTLVESDTAVPLRTVVRRVRTGNCSTQYPLSVRLSLDGGPEATLAFLSDGQVVLRRPDGGVAASLGLRDASPWTGSTILDGTCRISLSIDSNEVDVDTPQQASALLAAIDQEIAAAQTDQRNYEALLALQAAYSFTRAVAESFHAELTSETMQELRRAAIAAAPAMEEAALGCGDALSEEQRDALFQLYVSLVALGDPAAWTNPDGSTRTLEDFYGPGSAAVLAQIEALAANASPDLETQYRMALQAAAAEVVRLHEKRALAVLQLAPWLGGGA